MVLGDGAHPRAYGENAVAKNAGGSKLGSSPRIRGKHTATPCYAPFTGLIPAHTGKTAHESVNFHGGGAHPRAYGENLGRHVLYCKVGGSSPRIRGKLPVPLSHPPYPGLIPAHTGKTVQVCHFSVSFRAHPRAYGENAERKTPMGSEQGSSPRIRGKH